MCTLVLLLCTIGSGPAFSAEVAATSESSTCAGCHREQHRQWQQSHHAKAMQEATEQTVLAQFDGSPTGYGDQTFRFFKRNDQFQVSIQVTGSAQPPLIFDIPYTFGYVPLQQYLARLPGGKFQALPVAWDSRPKTEGGQRWYALESDLDWDHPGFTWNTSCAACHSTGLRKNYDAASERFDTRWDEINVACASCHGDAQAHQRWLREGKPATQKYAGFGASLAERGQWRWLAGAPIAQRESKPAGEQLSACGQCHSRRDQIGEWHPGTELLEHSVPAIVAPPLYFADGQIRDEVFALGSFMQSRMHAAGVVCSNCHEPHSLELRAEGDALCQQCHQPAAFSTMDHHGHSPASVNCVDCHMPATVYMGVDARRDHRFGIPDPILSSTLGSPDPCSACHNDLSPEDLAAAIASFDAEDKKRVAQGAAFEDSPSPSIALTRMFAEVADGTVSPSLRYRLDGDTFSAIRQAAILTSVDVNADAGMRAIVESKLRHAEPMIRLAAVRSLSGVALDQRWSLLSPLLNDPVRAVRFEVASQLAQASLLPLSPEQSAALEHSLGVYEVYLQSNQDSPAQASNLGNFYAAQNKTAEAQSSYQRAVALDPGFLYPYLQLAELARAGVGAAGEGEVEGQGQANKPLRSEKAWLDAAMQVAPHHAELHYRYGLYWVRAGDYVQALAALEKSQALEPMVEQYAMTYAIALESTGNAESAVATLAAFYRSQPQASAAADLLLRYCLKYNKLALARDHLQQWLAHQPDNPQAQRWRQHLQQRGP